MEVTWLSHDDQQTIFLNSPLTESQAAQLKTYIETSNALCDTMDADVKSVSAVATIADLDRAVLVSQAIEIKAALDKIQALAQPEALLAGNCYNNVIILASEAVEMLDETIALLQTVGSYMIASIDCTVTW